MWLSICLFVLSMARRGEWLGGIDQAGDDDQLGHAVHVLAHAQGGVGVVQGAAAESQAHANRSRQHGGEHAATTRGARQLDNQVKSPISMNVVVEDMEKTDS